MTNDMTAFPSVMAHIGKGPMPSAVAINEPVSRRKLYRQTPQEARISFD
jgi:hypothetical protein